MIRTSLLLCLPCFSNCWLVCDVTSPRFGAKGDGLADDTNSIRFALAECNEIVLPEGFSFLSGPLNLTSNQRLQIDGNLLASQNKEDYPLIAPLLGLGWGVDENCFPPGFGKHEIVLGSLRMSPVIGAFNVTNVSVTGSGVVDGQGEPWYENCTRCHYPPHNDSKFCQIASRPKLVEFLYSNGVAVHGAAPEAPLTLKNSPFWTLTPAYSQNIHIHDLRIVAPMTMIGNTDGCNLYSCRNAVIENLYIKNADDGVTMKSGIDEYGMNLAVPTENVIVRNITCDSGSRCGFALGSDISGGIRNVTFRDSVIRGDRGLLVKTVLGRGGYVRDISFENIYLERSGIDIDVGYSDIPMKASNHFATVINNVQYLNVSGPGTCKMNDCLHANGSACHGMVFSGQLAEKCHCTHCKKALPTPRYTCKASARTEFDGIMTLPWGVCIPADSPVNNFPDYPNWGPTVGDFASLASCQAKCVSTQISNEAASLIV